MNCLPILLWGFELDFDLDFELDFGLGFGLSWMVFLSGTLRGHQGLCSRLGSLAGMRRFYGWLVGLLWGTGFGEMECSTGRRMIFLS